MGGDAGRGGGGLALEGGAAGAGVGGAVGEGAADAGGCAVVELVEDGENFLISGENVL